MKKILSMVLVLLLSLSCFMIAGVSAEDNAFTPSEESIIYFEVPEDWAEVSYNKVFCYIYEYEGYKLMEWQSKIGKCVQDTEQPNLYSYDISKVGGLEKGKFYIVIFSINTGAQIYPTLISTDCYGDTLYCDGTKFDDPYDHNKSFLAAYWKNQNKFVYGPLFDITSLGKVVGSALPPYITTTDRFSNFLNTSQLKNAQQYSGKSDQELIDDIANKLSITKNSVEKIINATNANLQWSKDISTAPSLLGDANEDDIVNIKDATAIQKHVAGYDITIDLGCADSDTNHTVNVKDATAIQKYIAGIEVVTPIGSLFTDSTTTTPA